MKHFLRYGTNAEQKYFTKNFDGCYDCIIINANIAVHSQSAIAIFITKKVSSKPFIIDPITHFLQHGRAYVQNDEGNIKSSIKKLINKYLNLPTSKVLDDSDYDQAYDDFSQKINNNGLDDEEQDIFVEKVIGFQKDLIQESSETDYEDYIKFAKENQQEIILKDKPEFLMSPYFLLDIHNFDKILGLNIRLGQLATNVKSDFDLYIPILIDQEVLLDDEKLDELAEQYLTIKNISGYMLWVDNFNEKEADTPLLKKFVLLLKKLKVNGLKVINMYGGYFSTSLINKDFDLLDGVSHSLAYGEHREAIPVGGGIPRSKFYVYALHQRVDTRIALQLMVNIDDKSELKRILGNTSKLIEVLRAKDYKHMFRQYFATENTTTFSRNNGTVSMNYPTSETKENAITHYLNTKRIEFSYIDKHANTDIIKELASDFNILSKLLPRSEVKHLKNWERVLKDI